MAIPNYHFYDGAALSYITARGEFTALTRIGGIPGRGYAVNHDRRIYIKHATSETGPWQFTFAPEHQDAIRDLFNAAGANKTFVVLVCGPVGVCALTYGEYAGALSEDFGSQRTLTVTRPTGGSFHVHGAGGEVVHAIPLNSFPECIFA
jgi:hypothetical protein